MLGNGTTSPILSIGSSFLPTSFKFLKLKNILLVSLLTKNLILVNQVCANNNANIEFHPKYFNIREVSTNKVILVGGTKQGYTNFQ